LEKIKILFDAQIFCNQKFGGISRYFSELMVGIKNDPHFENALHKFYTDNKHLQTYSFSKFSSFINLPYFRGKARINKFLVNQQQQTINKLLRDGKYNVFHPTYYDTEFLKYLPKNKPFVLTVHDMIHELLLDKLENIHKETTDKQVLIPKASHIIAVSENTKQDILSLYPKINADKISVIYHGNSLKNSNSLKTKLTYRYFLYVGLRNSYKNFNWLLQNIAPYLKKNQLNLVCAGGEYFNDAELLLIKQLNIEDQIHHVSISSDLYLVSLYKNAIALIFPSLYEGFGIPILEAFSCECPVILNNNSSLPEIAKDAALYFNVENPEGLLNHMNNIQGIEVRNRLIEKGKLQLKNYSWEKSVQEHLKIYQSFS